MENLLLVLLGFFLGLVPGWYARKQRLKVHWGALEIETELCREKAQAYLDDKIMAPLYRLPNKAYETSFPVLLSDAAILPNEVDALVRFYSQVEDFNRGLDDAAELNKENRTAPLKEGYKRNLLKARQIVAPPEGKDNLYLKAIAILADKNDRTAAKI